VGLGGDSEEKQAVGHIRVNPRRLALLGVFVGAILVVVGAGLQFGGPVALMVGGGMLAALCFGLDFEPERE
jgi:hypothetical protein